MGHKCLRLEKHCRGEGSKNGMRKASVVPTIQREHVLYLTGDHFKDNCAWGWIPNNFQKLFGVQVQLGLSPMFNCEIENLIFRKAESPFRWVSVLCLTGKLDTSCPDSYAGKSEDSGVQCAASWATVHLLQHLTLQDMALEQWLEMQKLLYGLTLRAFWPLQTTSYMPDYIHFKNTFATVFLWARKKGSGFKLCFDRLRLNDKI